MPVTFLTILAIVASVVAWIAWLVFCAYTARRDGEQAAKIIAAAGTSYPKPTSLFRLRRRPTDGGSC